MWGSGVGRRGAKFVDAVAVWVDVLALGPFQVAICHLLGEVGLRRAHEVDGVDGDLIKDVFLVCMVLVHLELDVLATYVHVLQVDRLQLALLVARVRIVGEGDEADLLPDVFLVLVVEIANVENHSLRNQEVVSEQLYFTQQRLAFQL